MQRQAIKRPKTYELIAERLEDMIASGELAVGDFLPTERELMDSFNVGRPAVREAIFALQRRGLVSTSSGRRAVVTTPSMSDVFGELDTIVQHLLRTNQSLENLFKARTFLETAVARNAATAMTDAEIAALKRALEKNTQAIGNREGFVQTDVAFHRLLFVSTRNPVFDAVNEALVAWLMNRWLELERTVETEQTANSGHVHIYEAIAARDPDAAEQAMKKHLNASWEMWRSQLIDRQP